MTVSCWDATGSQQSTKFPHVRTCAGCTKRDLGHLLMRYAFDMPYDAQLVSEQKQQLELALAQKALEAKPKAKIVTPTGFVPKNSCDYLSSETGTKNEARWKDLTGVRPFDGEPKQKARWEASLLKKVPVFAEVPREQEHFLASLASQRTKIERLANRTDIAEETQQNAADTIYHMDNILRHMRQVAQLYNWNLAYRYHEEQKSRASRDAPGAARMQYDEKFCTELFGKVQKIETDKDTKRVQAELLSIAQGTAAAKSGNPGNPGNQGNPRKRKVWCKRS